MKRILLVEDHEEIWDILSRRLERHGFDVAVATNGQQGVERAHALRPAIILLKMALPVMSGWVSATRIRSDARTAHIPIIALTTRAVSGDQARVIAAGCDDCHAMPVEFSRLLVQIGTLTGNRVTAGRQMNGAANTNNTRRPDR